MCIVWNVDNLRGCSFTKKFVFWIAHPSVLEHFSRFPLRLFLLHLFLTFLDCRLIWWRWWQSWKNWSDDNDLPERGNVQTQSWRCWGLFLCRAAFLGLRLGPGVILMLVGMIRIIIIDHLPDSAAPFILDESSFKLSHVVKRLRLHNNQVMVNIS